MDVVGASSPRAGPTVNDQCWFENAVARGDHAPLLVDLAVDKAQPLQLI